MVSQHYIQYSIPSASTEQREEIIYNLSSFSISGIEETESGLEVFGLAGELEEGAIETMLTNFGMAFSKQVIENQNWNALWEASFDPVVIDDFASIRASFHPAPAGVVYDLVITPQMSFGTGHHPTTWLMVKSMAEMDFKDKSVIDFGTGTGVLAILAEKLGASRITGIDTDSWSMENASENVAVNGCSRIELFQKDNLDELDPAQILLANINRHILLEHMNAIAGHMHKGGFCLMSGLLEEDREMVQPAAEKAGFAFTGTLSREGWIALLFQKL